MEDLVILIGDFVVWQGQKYRTTPYWKEYELFAVEDVDKKLPLRRVSKEEVSDYYTTHAWCDYKGMRYNPIRIESGICYYKNYVVHDAKEQCRPVGDFNEIWIAKNKSGKWCECRTVYLSERCNGRKPSDDIFYVEEMANGNQMTAHNDEIKGLNETIDDLMALYGARLYMEAPNEQLLMVDYYMSRITIDGVAFCLDYDWGIITISPEDSNGNKYIWEIVEYFNRCEKEK